MARKPMRCRTDRTKLVDGWEEILRRMKREESQKSAVTFRRQAEVMDSFRDKDLSLPGIERSKSHVRVMKSFKLLSPAHKRAAILATKLHIHAAILSPLVLRSITPPPATSGRKHGSPDYYHQNVEATTQCQDIDFPFSPRASVLDTGNLFVMNIREERKKVGAVGS